MNAFVLNLTLLVILMATLTFTWVQVLATLPSSVNKHHWPDLAAGQWQDVVRLLGVHTAAPQGELLLRARQQPQQHLERKRTSTSAPYVVFAVTSGQQSTHCGHWSQAEWEGWLSIFSTKVCVSLMASGWTYRGPLGQTVEVGVQRRREHVQVEWVDVALQPITDLVESGGHTDTMFAASTDHFFFYYWRSLHLKRNTTTGKKIWMKSCGIQLQVLVIVLKLLIYIVPISFLNVIAEYFSFGLLTT